MLNIEKLCFNCFHERENLGVCPYCGYNNVGNTSKFPGAMKEGSILNGQYIVGRVLGQGGFGITYLALDYQLELKVAIKEYLPEGMAARLPGTALITVYEGDKQSNFQYGAERFLDEARVLAKFIGNKNIVSVKSYFRENNTAYFVMDYIEGINFKTYIKNMGGKITYKEALRILIPVMDALALVHREGVIHRDVTPDNIYITREDEIKLLDFGSARYSMGDKSKCLDVILKAGYAPKEQYLSKGKQGPYTDVYSLAACFYASITGYLPPEALERLEHDEILPISARGFQIPGHMEIAIMKGLSLQAEDRYQNMNDFKAAILASIPSMDPTQSYSTTPLQPYTPTSVQGVTPQYSAKSASVQGVTPQYSATPTPIQGAMPQYSATPTPVQGAMPQYSATPTSVQATMPLNSTSQTSSPLPISTPQSTQTTVQTPLQTSDINAVLNQNINQKSYQTSETTQTERQTSISNQLYSGNMHQPAADNQRVTQAKAAVSNNTPSVMTNTPTGTHNTPTIKKAKSYNKILLAIISSAACLLILLVATGIYLLNHNKEVSVTTGSGSGSSAEGNAVTEDVLSINKSEEAKPIQLILDYDLKDFIGEFRELSSNLTEPVEISQAGSKEEFIDLTKENYKDNVRSISLGYISEDVLKDAKAYGASVEESTLVEGVYYLFMGVERTLAEDLIEELQPGEEVVANKISADEAAEQAAAEKAAADKAAAEQAAADKVAAEKAAAEQAAADKAAAEQAAADKAAAEKVAADKAAAEKAAADKAAADKAAADKAAAKEAAKCTYCNGTGKVECTWCDGTGKCKIAHQGEEEFIYEGNPCPKTTECTWCDGTGKKQN